MEARMNSRTMRYIKYAGAALAVLIISLSGGILGARFTTRAPGDSRIPAGIAFGTRDPGVSDAVSVSDLSGTDVTQAIQDRFRSVAATTLPVVVQVNVKSKVTRPAMASPFDFFFGNPERNNQEDREYSQEGMGSGVIVARDGRTVYVLTNNHVAGGAEEIEIVMDSGRSYSAALVGTDSLMDLALVSFQTADQVPVAVLGDSESVAVGDWVFAVGNPLGFQSTLTSGVVSAISREAQPGSGMPTVTAFIQTDAAINQGNSGGALVNLEGEVVGINTWIASQNGGNIGLGFAIPINNAKHAITEFIESGSVSYSWLGVQTGTPDEELSEDLKLKGTGGAFVFGVYEDSPADRVALQPGDLIISVGNQPIPDSGVLVRTIASLKVGESTAVAVIRDGKQVELSVRTERREENSGSDTAALWPGMTVIPINSEIREQFSLKRGDQGVMVASVNTDSVAGTGGLQQGDIITAVNESPVSSAGDFYRLINTPSGQVQFRILRGGRGLTIGFDRPETR
jgi:serine protease Do